MLSTTQSTDRSLYLKWLKIASIVCLYWFISISMFFFNNYLLSSEELKFDAPIFITASQCSIACIILLLMECMGKLFPEYVIVSIDINFSTAKKVAPLSLIFVAMVTFNNLALKGLGVAFYTVVRSLTTVFSVILLFIILHQKVPVKVLLCCAMIVFGMWLGMEEYATNDYIILHMIFGVLASLFLALYAIFVKKSLPLVDDNIWKLLFYNNLSGVIILLPVMTIIKEWAIVLNFQYWSSPPFWLLLLVVGMLGVTIGYISSLQIQVTSPLTHTISGAAKAHTQTIIACMYDTHYKTPWWWFCNSLVLGGSSVYAIISMREMKKNHGKNFSSIEQNN